MTLSQFPTSLSVNGVSQDTEREAFKAWCGTEYGFDLQRDALGDYAHSALVLQWEAWQARASIAVRPSAASQPSEPFREHLAQQAENINQERLSEALTWMGSASGGGGKEGFAARLGENVNRLTAAIASHKRNTLAAPQPPAASLAQAVKAGLAKRFPDDPPMEIHPLWCSGGCCNPAAASEPLKTKQVWVAWTNTDLTEGRGSEVPLAVCETEGTARRLGAKGYVMGGPSPVTECVAILSGRHWLVPGRIITPTMEDQRLSQLYADQRAAVERAKAAGLSVEDLKLLGAS